MRLFLGGRNHRPDEDGGTSPQTSLSSAAVAGPVDVGSAATLLAQGRALVHFGDTEVVVLLTRRGIFGFENQCPHLGRSLADARVSGRTVVCAAHQRGFDLLTGGPKGRPVGSSTERLRLFNVAIASGHLWLEPPAGYDRGHRDRPAPVSA